MVWFSVQHSFWQAVQTLLVSVSLFSCSWTGSFSGILWGWGCRLSSIIIWNPFDIIHVFGLYFFSFWKILPKLGFYFTFSTHFDKRRVQALQVSVLHICGLSVSGGYFGALAAGCHLYYIIIWNPFDIFHDFGLLLFSLLKDSTNLRIF
jgi:hypothetical protein